MAAAFTPPAAALLADVRAALAPLANPTVAAGQAAYLKHKFPALGVYTPARRAATRALLVALPDRHGAAWGWPALAAAADALWAGAPEREFPLTACDVLARHHRVWLPRPTKRGAAAAAAGSAAAPAPTTDEVLGWVHAKLTSPQAHWDVVDFLATTVVGDVLRRDEAAAAATAAADAGGGDSPAAATMRVWLTSDVVWVRRSAVLSQLKSGASTNVALFWASAGAAAADDAFFVAKALGWALREYRRTERVGVDAWIVGHPELTALARREALRHGPLSVGGGEGKRLREEGKGDAEGGGRRRGRSASRGAVPPA